IQASRSVPKRLVLFPFVFRTCLFARAELCRLFRGWRIHKDGRRIPIERLRCQWDVWPRRLSGLIVADALKVNVVGDVIERADQDLGCRLDLEDGGSILVGVDALSNLLLDYGVLEHGTFAALDVVVCNALERFVLNQVYRGQLGRVYQMDFFNRFRDSLDLL